MMRAALFVALLAMGHMALAQADPPVTGPGPIDGATCATTADPVQCCKDKAAKGESDKTCDGVIPPGPGPIVGSTCATVNPADFDKCCREKRANYEFDPTCKKRPDYGPGPIVGNSCGSLAPEYRHKCCEEKKWDGEYDRACVEWKPWRPAHKPRSCGRLPYHAAKRCCEIKIRNCDYSDKYCSIPSCKKWAKGSKKAMKKCCEAKKDLGLWDKTCKAAKAKKPCKGCKPKPHY